MKINRILIAFFLLTFSGLTAQAATKCDQLVNEELARLGLAKTDGSAVDCVNKGKKDSIPPGVTWETSNIKNGPKADYREELKLLQITLGHDTITGDSLVYDIYFTADCDGIDRIAYYGALGPGMSINLNRKKCEKIIKDINKPQEYDYGVNVRAYQICKNYELKMPEVSNPDGMGPLDMSKVKKLNIKINK